LFILDKDPKRAAQSLISHHIRYYIVEVQLIIRIFYTNEKCVGRYKLWKKFLKIKANYEWLVIFYKELQEIYKNNISKIKAYYGSMNGFKDSMLETPSGLDEESTLKFPQTKSLDIIKKVMDRYRNKVKFNKDSIKLNRQLYILNQYKTNLFPCGCPEWYLETLDFFEARSNKDEIRIKINLDKDNGYTYYYNKKGGTWIQIDNVPHEMKYIINAFLFPLSGL
jgi:hypothetical protein